MKEFPNCRFLETVTQMSERDIDPAELLEQRDEFLRIARDYLCGASYFEVYDTFDTLTRMLERAVGRKKKALS